MVHHQSQNAAERRKERVEPPFIHVDRSRRVQKHGSSDAQLVARNRPLHAPVSRLARYQEETPAEFVVAVYETPG